MKHFFKYSFITFAFHFVYSLTSAQNLGFESYYAINSMWLSSPGSLGIGLYGWENPALLSYQKDFDLMFSWQNKDNNPFNKANRFGLFAATNGLGFGWIKNKIGEVTQNDYRISFGFGDKSNSSGIGYGWSGGDTTIFKRSSVITLGSLSRNQFLSYGVSGTIGLDEATTEGILDLGIRPFKNEFITLFADYGVHTGQKLFAGNWSTGAVIEPIAGVRLTGRYFNDKNISLGLQFSLGGLGLSMQEHISKEDNSNDFQTYSIRLGGYDRNIFRGMFNKKNSYLSLNMNGGMKYQRFQFFDNSKTLLSTIDQIIDAKEDKAISGICINISGMSINKEMLWEIREALKEFKNSGKKVVIFFDRVGIDDYHFASVADKIIMDPLGTMSLEGYVAGRTFLKGTLEKLGVGYDELRFFKYKSAVENFSRDKFSIADKEQRQNLINDYYTLAKNEICEGRKISSEKFDNTVNNQMMLNSSNALSSGYIDKIGRWESVDSVIKEIEGNSKMQVGYGFIEKNNLPEDNYWGNKPTIAVIYAIGACAMDEGINARSLVQYCDAAVNNPNIKAIVLRVDSPGGDALASDLISEALKKAKGKKPVIISQGYVAGSGGYWLSMYGDTIIAAPNTITGSIGVISGWMYNKEAKEKLGISTDMVKVGNHADIGFGMTLPIIGLGLPDREFTVEERSFFEKEIREMYKEFVTKVATGRNKKFEEIEPLAQGHFYSGTEGLKIGLLDMIGGIETAINVAKKKAGLENEEIDIVSMPSASLADFSGLMPKLIGVDVKQVLEDPILQSLKYRIKNNGKIMPAMPLEIEIESK